jgi:hypothetical protein
MAVPFSEESFWQIVSVIDFSREDPLEPAILALASRSVADIARFDDLLAEKLFALDTEAHARQIGAHAFTGDEAAFSVDHFLYARCRAVAAGRDEYARILADPSRMPKGDVFEPLLFLAAQAHQEKTGEDYEHLPETDIETYSNEAGWR